MLDSYSPADPDDDYVTTSGLSVTQLATDGPHGDARFRASDHCRRRRLA